MKGAQRFWQNRQNIGIGNRKHGMKRIQNSIHQSSALKKRGLCGANMNTTKAIFWMELIATICISGCLHRNTGGIGGVDHF